MRTILKVQCLIVKYLHLVTICSNILDVQEMELNLRWCDKNNVDLFCVIFQLFEAFSILHAS